MYYSYHPQPLYTVQRYQNSYHLLPNTPTHTYSHVFIWLHGLAESPDFYLNFFLYYHSFIPYPQTTKIIIPCAPLRRITADFGQPSFSWFDLYDYDQNSGNALNFNHVLESAYWICDIINQEAIFLKGNYKNIFLGGFSQGAIMSLFIGYSFFKLLGGIICCSGVLIPQTKIFNNENINLPVFISHGILDDVIFIQRNIYSLMNFNKLPGVEVHYYPKLGHEIDWNVIRDIYNFLRNNMKF